MGIVPETTSTIATTVETTTFAVDPITDEASGSGSGDFTTKTPTPTEPETTTTIKLDITTPPATTTEEPYVDPFVCKPPTSAGPSITKKITRKYIGQLGENLKNNFLQRGLCFDMYQRRMYGSLRLSDDLLNVGEEILDQFDRFSNQNVTN